MTDPVVIGGVYHLGEKIGRGGMAVVYRARVDLAAFDFTMLYAYTQVNGANHAERCRSADAFAASLSGKSLDIQTIRTILEAHGIPLPGEEVAIKLANSHVDEARFHAEWRNLVCLHHENVIQVYGGGMHGEFPYYAMEVIPVLIAPERILRSFTLAQKLEFTRQAASGLEYLHLNGIIHRDVKPDNLIACERSDGRFVVKVTDLGIAKNSESSMSMTMTNTVMGTPSFMSPEQARSSRDVDLRADIYSLGATLYLLVGGRVPYDQASTLYEVIGSIAQGTPPTPIEEICPGLPVPVQKIIHCAMAFNPEDRYSSMKAMAEDIDLFLQRECGGRANTRMASAVLSQETILAGGELAQATLTGTVEKPLLSQDTLVAASPLSAATQMEVSTKEYNFQTISLASTVRKKKAEVEALPPVRSTGRIGIPLAGAALLLLAAGGVYFFRYHTGSIGAREAAESSVTKVPLTAAPPAPVSQADAEELALFKEQFTRLKALETAETTVLLEEATAIGRVLLKRNNSEIEEGAIRDILDKVDRRRRDILNLQEYERLAAQAKGYLQEGKFQEAVKAAERAREHQRSEEMEKLIFTAKRLGLLLDQYQEKMALGAECLKGGRWVEAEGAFASATGVEGYGEDKAAATGIADALRGLYLSKVSSAEQALKDKKWELADQSYLSALKVKGFEADAAALEGRKQGVLLREASERADAFQGWLKKAAAHRNSGGFAEAEKALLEGMEIQGYQDHKEATALLGEVRKEHFQGAVTQAQAALKGQKWPEAVLLFREALAVSGYEEDAEAEKGLATAVQGERDADWSSGPQPTPRTVITLGKNGAAIRAGQRTVPDMSPQEPEMFDLFRP